MITKTQILGILKGQRTPRERSPNNRTQSAPFHNRNGAAKQIKRRSTRLRGQSSVHDYKTQNDAKRARSKEQIECEK